MDFIDKKIEAYALEHSSEAPEMLTRIDRETHLQVLAPRMLSGHLQGRMLSMLSHMVRPKHVLEIGTYTGYSALCLAEGLVEGGSLITIDVNEELEDRTRSYFDTSKYKEAIDFKVGDAMQIIPTLNQNFDLVFIDADKRNYSNYYNLVIDKLTTGGIIIADNVLWSGKVLHDAKNIDRDTQEILNFNRMVQEDNRVENVLFPVRDGLMVIRKK